MIGRHVIRTWSSTQPSVTLSSGEAEFYGLVKAAGAGLGHQSIMSDFGLKVPVRVWTDSSAAIGISSRSGLGKLRHLETHTLWVQEKVRTGAIQVRKVRGEVNPADLFTKHLPSSVKIAQLVKLFGCDYREGRSAAAPLLRPAEFTEGEGGQPSGGHLPAFEMREAEAHNIDVLPHLHCEDDLERLFPLLRASPLGENVEDWQPSEECQGHTVGRSGTTSRVHGRCEGSTSVTPSRRSSNEESAGGPEARGAGGAREYWPPGSSRR
jgi:hypothetical protein